MAVVPPSHLRQTPQLPEKRGGERGRGHCDQDPSLHTQDAHSHPRYHRAALGFAVVGDGWWVVGGGGGGLCPSSPPVSQPLAVSWSSHLPASAVCAVTQGSPTHCGEACLPWLSPVPASQGLRLMMLHWLWGPRGPAAKGQQLVAMSARS